MPSSWHILYVGRVTEHVSYLGSSRWAWSSVDDLSGTELADRFSTKRLIEWVLDRDADDAETSTRLAHAVDPEAEEPEGTALGARGARLLVIAQAVGAELCARRLHAISSGNWPAAPRVQTITGVRRRAVWRGVEHRVYIARTSTGLANLYPPDANNIARVVLEGAASSEEGWLVRLTKRNLRDIARYQDLLQRL